MKGAVEDRQVVPLALIDRPERWIMKGRPGGKRDIPVGDKVVIDDGGPLRDKRKNAGRWLMTLRTRCFG
jgi:hypothetical protein